MRNRILVFLLIPLIGLGQNSYNMDLLGTYEWPSEGNDIWGWFDPATGEEYALVGLNDGFACVNVTVPTNPIQEFYISDVSSTWRM